MIDRERTKLLFAPYKAPRLRRRDRVFCLFRDCDVVITSWTDARISWPRCRAVHHRRGGPGLLVDDELLRAIRSESALALKYWFEVGTRTVWNWRKTFGVGKWGTEGSRRLHKALSEAGAEVTRGQPLSSKQVEQRRQHAIKLNLGRNLKLGYHGRWWTKREMSLLGKLPDKKVAKRIGRPVNGVRIMRTRLGIPSADDRRRKGLRRRKGS
jgi:hypothetical protein